MSNLKKIYYDIEVYKNFWLIVFQNNNGKVTEIRSDEDFLPYLQAIDKVKRHRLFVGYNNTHYDAIILEIILRNRHNNNLTNQLYHATQDLIYGEEWGGRVLKKYCGGEAVVTTYQLDLMQMTAQHLSLKEFGVRIHHEKLQTLPLPPDTVLDFLDVPLVVDYCKNDVTITKKLHDTVFKETVEVKEHLVNTFNLPPHFYSKSNRNITEHILCDPSLKPFKKEFNYECPYDITYQNDELNFLLMTYENIDFSDDVSFSESVTINDLQLDFALGGIHGSVKNYQGKNLIDIDVASYYPNLIRNLKALPQTVYDHDAFYNMIDERVALKKVDPAKATAYKVVINTVYGAMNYTYGNRLGKLYDLESLYKITITGQLLLAKLIEDITLAGYKVIYANTDGIMIEDNGSTKYKQVCEEWEEFCGLTLEFANIKKAYIRDVNNFILLKDDGKLKTKGEYNGELGSKTSAFAGITNKALLNYILYDIPLEETVRNGTKIEDYVLYHKFSKQYEPTHIVDRKTKDTHDFDKVIRYYLSTDADNYIMAYNTNTNQHIRKQHTSNVVSLPILPQKLPNDIDYEQYIGIAYDKLESLTGVPAEYNPYIVEILQELKLAFE